KRLERIQAPRIVKEAFEEGRSRDRELRILRIDAPHLDDVLEPRLGEERCKMDRPILKRRPRLAEPIPEKLPKRQMRRALNLRAAFDDEHRNIEGVLDVFSVLERIRKGERGDTRAIRIHMKPHIRPLAQIIAPLSLLEG